MTKIVFSDIDGTLLTDDKRVTAKTKKAVKELLAKNIPFVLVSGRMPEAIYPIVKKMGLTIPLVCYSGGLVLTKEGEPLASTTMQAADIAPFLQEAAARFPEASINYYAGHRWFAENLQDPQVIMEMQITGAEAEEASFASCLQQGLLPHKILMIMEPADCERAERELRKDFPRLHIVRSLPTLLEVMDASVTKAKGIEVMLRHFGLKVEESLSFGDNYNDLEMLRYTGVSVAMGNAPQEIKEAATDITLSNEEDGIYAYLVRHGLIAG